MTSSCKEKKHLAAKPTELSLKAIIRLLPSFAFENLVCVLFPGSLDVLHEQLFYYGQEVESIFSLKKLIICKLIYKCQWVHCAWALEWYYRLFSAQISRTWYYSHNCKHFDTRRNFKEKMGNHANFVSLLMSYKTHWKLVSWTLFIMETRKWYLPLNINTLFFLT